MNSIDVYAEIGVRQVAVAEACRVREENVDQKRGEGEEDAETELAEAGIDIVRRDEVVIVAVPEAHVLLKRRRRVVGLAGLNLGRGVGCVSGRFSVVAVGVLVRGGAFGNDVVGGTMLVPDGGDGQVRIVALNGIHG